MQRRTDTVQGKGEEVWSHNRNISNRYMLSTSDKEDGATAAAWKQKILLSLDSLSLFRSKVEADGRRGEVPGVASVLHIFTL